MVTMNALSPRTIPIEHSPLEDGSGGKQLQESLFWTEIEMPTLAALENNALTLAMLFYYFIVSNDTEALAFK